MSSTATLPETAAPQGGPAKRTSALEGKYMTFKLANEEYGLEILKVREIIGLMDITRVPRAPDCISGVINLRGKVIPVVNLRLKFGMPGAEATDQTVIIVVQYALAGEDLTMGVLVDEVLEVLSIGRDQIEPTPNFGSAAGQSDFILGVGKADRRVIFLLDIGRILTADEALAAVEAGGGK
ncbi:MAG: chemotaxis protein CheW [Candidatus Krumholzibacteriia bacterium]